MGKEVFVTRRDVDVVSVLDAFAGRGRPIRRALSLSSRVYARRGEFSVAGGIARRGVARVALDGGRLSVEYTGPPPSASIMSMFNAVALALRNELRLAAPFLASSSLDGDPALVIPEVGVLWAERTNSSRDEYALRVEMSPDGSAVFSAHGSLLKRRVDGTLKRFVETVRELVDFPGGGLWFTDYDDEEETPGGDVPGDPVAAAVPSPAPVDRPQILFPLALKETVLVFRERVNGRLVYVAGSDGEPILLPPRTDLLDGLGVVSNRPPDSYVVFTPDDFVDYVVRGAALSDSGSVTLTGREAIFLVSATQTSRAAGHSLELEENAGIEVYGISDSALVAWMYRYRPHLGTRRVFAWVVWLPSLEMGGGSNENDCPGVFASCNMPAAAVAEYIGLRGYAIFTRPAVFAAIGMADDPTVVALVRDSSGETTIDVISREYLPLEVEDGSVYLVPISDDEARRLREAARLTPKSETVPAEIEPFVGASRTLYISDASGGCALIGKSATGGYSCIAGDVGLFGAGEEDLIEVIYRHAGEGVAATAAISLADLDDILAGAGASTVRDTEA